MTEHEAKLKEYVEQLAALQRSISHNDWLYHGVESIVAAIGQFDVAQPLPKGFKHGKMGRCFQNAFRLMEKGLVYVEGIAVPACTNFPVHHGWCVDELGNVFDSTWRDGIAYFGVHLNKRFVYQRAMRRGKYGIFGDTDSFDLYKNGLPEEALHTVCVSLS